MASRPLNDDEVLNEMNKMARFLLSARAAFPDADDVGSFH
jgi:hypothetical protein